MLLMAKSRRPVGRQLRRAMERARLDQNQVAAALGVSRGAVNSWLNDRAYPMNSVGALEDLLDVRLDEENDEDATEAEAETARLRRDVEQLKAEMREWRKLAQELAEQRGKGNEDPEARAV